MIVFELCLQSFSFYDGFSKSNIPNFSESFVNEFIIIFAGKFKSDYNMVLFGKQESSLSEMWSTLD